MCLIKELIKKVIFRNFHFVNVFIFPIAKFTPQDGRIYWILIFMAWFNVPQSTCTLCTAMANQEPDSTQPASLCDYCVRSSTDMEATAECITSCEDDIDKLHHSIKEMVTRVHQMVQSLSGEDAAKAIKKELESFLEKSNELYEHHREMRNQFDAAVAFFERR